MFDGCDRETPMEALKRVTAERDSLAEQLRVAREALAEEDIVSAVKSIDIPGPSCPAYKAAREGK